MNSPLLTAIIVAYNSADIIAETVQHLEEVTAHLDTEILVVDNASSDSSSDLARKAIRRGRVIRSDENLGFGRGVNIGLREARGRFSLMMNDDVRPQPRCIEQLLEVASQSSVGLVGPRMISTDGTPSFAVRSQLPGLLDEFARVSDLVRRRSDRFAYPTTDDPTEVGMLVCACVMGRTEVLRGIGGFNDAFFMYGEDIDICRRLVTHGYRLMTVRTAVALHHRDIAPGRRPRGHDFSERILEARNTYYRIWLPRWQRVLVNLWRAIGPSDQPFRLKYHLAKAARDGGSLEHLRDLPVLPESLPDDGHTRHTSQDRRDLGTHGRH